MKIKKLYEDAKLPTYSSEGASGMDLYVHHYELTNGARQVRYHFGVAVEIPEGYEGQLRMRSSVCKTAVRLSNAVGTIDSDYRGELMAVMDVQGNGTIYGEGERAAQLVICPVRRVAIEEADELSETQRGEGGYGSTGH